MNLAYSLSIYSNTSIQEAMSTQPSVAKKFFESKAFSGWEKSREAEMKTQVAIIERITGVIRACIVVAKTISKLGRIR